MANKETDLEKLVEELMKKNLETNKQANQQAESLLRTYSKIKLTQEEIEKGEKTFNDLLEQGKKTYEEIDQKINILKENKESIVDSEQIILELQQEQTQRLKNQFQINQKALLNLIEQKKISEEKGNLSKEELADLDEKIQKLKLTTEEQGRALEKTEKEKEVKEKILSIGKEIIQASKQYGSELEKHIIQLNVLNGGVQDYNGSIREGNRLMYASSVGTGLSIEELNKASQSLSQTMIGLSTQTANSVKDMGNAVAQLGKLGVDAATASKSFDSLVTAMGKTPQQAVKIQDSFTQMAAKNRLALSSVNQAFAENSSRFVGYGEQMTKVLAGLAEQSLKTGIAIGKLVSIAQQFDTFEGAAKAVGNLNALLGGDYLNSIELLTASDDERIRLLKEAVAASGMQFESMNRFQKMAIANAAGISDLNEAAKLFGQTSLQNTRQQAEGVEVQKTLAEQAQSATLAMDKLKSSFNGLILVLEPIVTVLMEVVNLFSKFVQGMNDLFSGGGKFPVLGAIITSTILYVIYSVIRLRTAFGSLITTIGTGVVNAAKKAAAAIFSIPKPPSIPPSASIAPTGPTGLAGGAFLANAGNMLKAAGSILLFAAALYVLAKALQEFSSDKINAKAIIPAIASIAALIVIFKTIDKATGQIAKGALGVGIMALALIALGVGLAMFFKVDWKLIAGIGAVILGLGLAIAGFGFAVSGPQALLIAAGIGMIIAISVALLVLGNSLEKISTSFKTLSELKNIGELSSNLIKFLDDLADTSVSPIKNLAEAIGLLAENLQKLASVSSNMAVNVSGNAKTVLTEQVNAAATAVTKTSAAVSNASANINSQTLIPAQQTTAFVPLVVQIDKKTIIEILKEDIKNIAKGQTSNKINTVGRPSPAFEAIDLSTQAD